MRSISFPAIRSCTVGWQSKAFSGGHERTPPDYADGGTRDGEGGGVILIVGHSGFPDERGLMMAAVESAGDPALTAEY